MFLVTADLDWSWTSDLHTKGDILQQSPEPAPPSPEYRVNCMVLDYVKWMVFHPHCDLCQVSQVMLVLYIQGSITPRLRVCRKGLPRKIWEPRGLQSQMCPSPILFCTPREGRWLFLNIGSKEMTVSLIHESKWFKFAEAHTSQILSLQ